MKEKFQPMKKVQLRGGFSDRNGIDKISTEIQLKDFDERTRNAFYNAIINLINYIEPNRHGAEYYYESLYESILKEVYCQVVENDGYAYGYAIGQCKEYVKSTILSDTYDSVLTLIEYICEWTTVIITERTIKGYEQVEGGCKIIYFDEREFFNEIFEKEFVGYRFVGEHIVAITDDLEIKEIEQSLDIKFKGCKTQIQNALRLLSDRDKPDYKNSIKESISAVESICSIITEKNKATLGDALKVLESKRGLKGQLKSAFEKLYNYTNDKGGIRHAEGLFVSDVSFEEAKFMLVSCCAFINYLIAEYGKIED